MADADDCVIEIPVPVAAIAAVQARHRAANQAIVDNMKAELDACPCSEETAENVAAGVIELTREEVAAAQSIARRTMQAVDREQQRFAAELTALLPVNEYDDMPELVPVL